MSARATALALLALLIVGSAHAVTCAAELPESAQARPAARAPIEARAALYASYSAKLEQLAAWCQERQLDAAVEELKSWLPKRDPDKLTLFLLPASVVSSDKEPSVRAEWRAKWQALREEQAEALVALATSAAADHHGSLAFELVTEAVREHPDHPLGRRILGYARYREAWHTPFEIRQLNANKVWHEKFGWLPKSHVDRYEKGHRYYQGRWTSVADEAALRGEVKRGWRVESDHYLVTTNHSLEEGVRLSRRLEMLYALWQQMFAPFVAGETELVRRFEGRPPRRPGPQHQVVFFRNRQEYNEALRSAQPKIDMTLGIYFDSARITYFFAGEGQEPSTLYHEATHQLFQEARPVAADVGGSENFWIVEGIACYMESLAEHAGYCTLGGANAGRMGAARHRVLEDNFYLPLSELVRLDMKSLQHDPRIAPLYSQSAGLADMFMHEGQGRYRDALVRYLEAVYAGRATPQTLADLTSTSYEALDRQYREFMSQGERVQSARSDTAR